MALTFLKVPCTSRTRRSTWPLRTIRRACAALVPAEVLGTGAALRSAAGGCSAACELAPPELVPRAALGDCAAEYGEKAGLGGAECRARAAFIGESAFCGIAK